MPASPLPDPAVRLVLVTAPEGASGTLARALVEEGVAACVNVLPGVRSVYRWEGEVAEGAEALLIVKTTLGALEDLRAAVLRRHPYQVPEFLVVPVESGLPDYLAWVEAETRTLPKDRDGS